MENQNIETLNIFQGLDEAAVKQITQDLPVVKYKAGESILAEDDASDSMYFIRKGKVEIMKKLSSLETPNAQLSVLGPGVFFGEMGVISNEPRSATARALDDVELLEIQRERFTAIAFQYPTILMNLMHNVSDRLRNTNVRFAELMDEMISKNRLMAIGMAASKIIHDIKTPLTVIVLTAQLIENISPQSSEFCQSIVKQVRLVDQMVREILEFARGEESEPLIQKVDMDVFMKDIYSLHETMFRGREIKFEVDNRVNEPAYFDENKIRRVIMNLIKNASEAIAENAGEIKVQVSLSSNWLQISVIDSGPGVPEKIRAELFQPFISQGKTHGTGLGLPICRKLVVEHKGRLEYIAPPEGGSRFDIRLPQNMK